MKNHKRILKKAIKKYIEGDEAEMVMIWFHSYSVNSPNGNKSFNFKNITTQKEWDKAKIKAGFGSTPFKDYHIYNLGCNTKEETERVRTLLDKLIL